VALGVEFPDKIRFYDLVLKSERGKLFVATDEELGTGAEVELSLKLGEAEPVRTVGKVVAKLTKSGAGVGQTPGVWVQLSEVQVESLRQLLTVEAGEAARITTRQHPRIRCALRVEIDKPIARTLRTRDISRGGVCLEGGLPVPVGQTVRMLIGFDDGVGVPVFGKVVWSRHNVCGVAFRFQNAEVRQEMADRVRALAGVDQVVFAKSSVLVVDDDVATLRAIERVLNGRGYGCIVASGGAEALSAARETQPGLIVLDVLLPGMNGLEVCRVLKRDAHTSRIPVVLTSVLPRGDLVMLLRDSGALGMLPKPYKIDALLGLVERVIDQTQAFGGGAGGPALFLRCELESEGLTAQGYLRDAADGVAFMVSYWGEPAGTKGRLTVHRPNDGPLELEVEVRDRIDWGQVSASEGALPGLSLQLAPGAAREELERWIAGRSQASGAPTILLVDDDRAHLEILAVVLRNSGFAPVALESALGLANAVAMAKPALVLLDYMIPGVDCRAVCESIRASAPSVPIWIYSSVSEDHLRKIVKEVGAHGAMRKGTRPTVIAEKIHEALKG
jgi:DNA-binding response OmpR family regulator/Tfp pilus assembly protein PilZ